MIDFWLAAGLLLLIALSFLLIPVLRERRAQREEDRTALNVALYEERVAELHSQQQEGVLSAEQMDSGRAEAARELLADTEGSANVRTSRLGKPLPLLAALLVPVLGLGLYLHFGASDKVELTREFAQAPQSMEEMTAPGACGSGPAGFRRRLVLPRPNLHGPGPAGGRGEDLRTHRGPGRASARAAGAMGPGAVLCRQQAMVGQGPGPDRRSPESRPQ